MVIMNFCPNRVLDVTDVSDALGCALPGPVIEGIYLITFVPGTYLVIPAAHITFLSRLEEMEIDEKA